MFNVVLTQLSDASFLFPPGRISVKFTNNLSGYQDYSGDNNKLRQKVIAGDLEFGSKLNIYFSELP